MITSTSDPISSPRAMRFRKAWSGITAACAKLEHAVQRDQAAVLRKITRFQDRNRPNEIIESSGWKVGEQNNHILPTGSLRRREDSVPNNKGILMFRMPLPSGGRRHS